ncbi:hypothetical protein [Blastococcus sp. VKM Ac-2987]|uniref:hypothetical protein n=1 Tax=Blastococcus sp. VKM Ac-2987 TaxID=3004141 RepID=UPI0022AB7EB3|nr:hypothetical protein [Blastococcus sp. VKM Ac-2987]MCZ2859555.1 hypothetical protein [Blastococcus sp. VKM Ac-2987]
MRSTSRSRYGGRRLVVAAAVLAGVLVAAVVLLVVRDRGSDTPVAFGDAERLPAAVEVVVTAAGWTPGSGAEVAGYVSGIVESGGECTATLERDDVRVEVSRPATADATTTACGWLEINDAQVTSGTWTATLSYRSSTTAAVSDETSLDVP